MKSGLVGIRNSLTAETKVEEFISGVGVVTRWERIRKDNHWLDAIQGVAGHLAGKLLGASGELSNKMQTSGDDSHASPPCSRAVMNH